MAGHDEMSSDEFDLGSSINSEDYGRIKSLFVTDKGKFKWCGEFKSLQLFVEKVLKIKGKWSSPGGGSKLFQSEDLSMRWYGSKETLTVGGQNSVDVKTLLSELANVLQDNADEVVVSCPTSSLCNQEKSTVPGNQDSLLLDNNIMFNELKGQFYQLRDEFDDHRSVINNLIQSSSSQIGHESKARDLSNDLTSQCFNSLQQENLKLKKENEILRDRLNTVSYVVSDLNTKIKDGENEKSSLITVIKLLHEDYRNTAAINEVSHQPELYCPV